MNYPLISEYIEAIKSAEDNFEELSYLRPVLDDDGLPVMTSGNFAVIFKMKDDAKGKFYALKCFTREQEGRAEAYRQITEELENVDSPYLVPIRYLEKELFVDTAQTDETEFPVLLMDWVEGETLDKYLRENLDDKYALEMLAYRFSQLAQWLIPQPFAHGDLKPDNILVRDDGTLVLVDYDGMYVPAMKGQKARELGSPDFRHPLRTENDFDEHIDDFPLVSILLSLKAISLKTDLIELYGATGRLLFSEKDYRNLSESLLIDALKTLMQDKELATLISIFILSSSLNSLALISCRLLNLNIPQVPTTGIISTKVTTDDWADSWKDEYGVVYSKDKKRLLGIISFYLPDYEILEGTETICDDSLNGIWEEDVIEGLMISGKVTIPSTVRFIGRNPFRADFVKIENRSPYFIVEDDVLYTSDKKRLITCFSKKSRIVIPDGVEIIDSFAFYGCEDISQIVIPETVSFIGDNPFIEMNFLCKKNVEIISKSPFFFTKKGSLYRKSPQLLISYFGKSPFLFVDEKTTEIGAFPFWSNSPKGIYLPSSIERMAEGALWGTTFSLQHVFVPLGTQKKFNELLPKDSDKLLELDPSLMTKDEFGTIYDDKRKKRLLKGCDIEEYTINDETIEICSFAFSDCTSLTKIDIPSSVTNIGNKAFSGCKSLRHIIIPSSVTNIGYEAFSGCKSLRHIIIPSSVISIGKGAFRDCYKLQSVEISSSIRVIEERLFDWCTSLNHIVIPKSIERIDNWAFNFCKNLKSVTILNSTIIFGEDVFSGCDSLCSIIVPIGTKMKFEKLLPKYRDKLIEKEEELSTKCTDDDLRNSWTDEFGAIYSKDKKRLLKCPKIKEFSIKVGTRVIADQTFEGSTELQEVQIPTSVELIGAHAFDSCWNLEKIEIPNSVKSIGKGCFDSCFSLREIIIPKGITKIEDRTFERCYKLQKVLLPESLREIGAYAFTICSIGEIEFPKQLKTIGYNAFWKAGITKERNASCRCSGSDLLRRRPSWSCPWS